MGVPPRIPRRPVDRPVVFAWVVLGSVIVASLAGGYAILSFEPHPRGSVVTGIAPLDPLMLGNESNCSTSGLYRYAFALQLTDLPIMGGELPITAVTLELGSQSPRATLPSAILELVAANGTVVATENETAATWSPLPSVAVTATDTIQVAASTAFVNATLGVTVEGPSDYSWAMAYPIDAGSPDGNCTVN